MLENGRGFLPWWRAYHICAPLASGGPWRMPARLFRAPSHCSGLRLGLGLLRSRNLPGPSRRFPRLPPCEAEGFGAGQAGQALRLSGQALRLSQGRLRCPACRGWPGGIAGGRVRTCVGSGAAPRKRRGWCLTSRPRDWGILRHRVQNPFGMTARLVIS